MILFCRILFSFDQILRQRLQFDFSAKTILNHTLQEQGDRLLVNYDNTLSDILAVINVSAHCRQFLQVECGWGYNGSSPDRYWLSRNNDIMRNWATPTGTKGCPCSLLEGKTLAIAISFAK